MKIGKIWNKLADPKTVPRLFAFCLGVILIVGFVVPMALNPDQIYTRPAPQEQVDEGLAIAPYDRGGEVLKSPGIINPHHLYPHTLEHQFIHLLVGLLMRYYTILEVSIQSLNLLS